jgi:hypothetical protein
MKVQDKSVHQSYPNSMLKSESIKNIADALLKFQEFVPAIEKDATNPFLHNKYASLPNIIKTIRPALVKAGISFSQGPSGSDSLETILMHGASGEWISYQYEMPAVKNDPQTKGSVITYMKRYALCAALGIAADDDDDGNAGSGQGQKQQPQTAAQNSLKWLNKDTPEYQGAIKKLKEGTTTVEKIKAAYKLNAAMEKEFRGIVPATQPATT